VLSPSGDFHYLNAAAVAALGYDDAAELLGRPGHETVHYKHPDGSPYPVEDCRLARARVAGAPCLTAERARRVALRVTT
jgi:PAS domain-containing protein